MNLQQKVSVQLPIAVGNPTSVVNTGSTTLYYGDEYVSDTRNSGSIAPGVAVTLSSGYYLISMTGPGQADLIVVPVPGEGSWNTAGGSGVPSGPAGGSLGGTYPNPAIAASAALPGSPTTTTQAQQDNSTKIATTAYTDAAVLAGASVGPSYGMIPTNFWNWRRALSNVRNGSGYGKILCVGDSTTEGLNAGGSNPFFTGAWPQRLAQLLNSYYVPAAIGLNRFADPAVTADTRWTPGTGWTANGSIAGFADLCAHGASGAAGTLTFAPGYSCDTIDVYYAKSGSSGSCAVSDEGGALATIAANGSNAVGKTTLTLHSLASNHVITFAGPTGGDFYLIGVDCYNSTVDCVRVALSGRSGSSAANVVGATGVWSDNANPFSSIGCIEAYAPDLTINMLGINDAQFGASTSTWLTAMEAINAAAQVSGDVLNVTVVPSNAAGLANGATGLALEVAYAAATKQLGPYVDINARWVDWATANSHTYYGGNNLHPTGFGYCDVAQAIFDALTRI